MSRDDVSGIPERAQRCGTMHVTLARANESLAILRRPETHPPVFLERSHLISYHGLQQLYFVTLCTSLIPVDLPLRLSSSHLGSGPGLDDQIPLLLSWRFPPDRGLTGFSPALERCEPATLRRELRSCHFGRLSELGSGCNDLLDKPGSSTSGILGSLSFCISTSWHAQSLVRIDHGQEETPDTPNL